MEIAAQFPAQTSVYCVFHAMCEEDVIAIMKHPATAVGSDAWEPRPMRSVYSCACSAHSRASWDTMDGS